MGILFPLKVVYMADDYYNEKDIEKEDYGPEIDVPFDPRLIRISTSPFTLGQLIDKIENDEVNFKTPFQRKSGLWDPTKQSRLIESVLLRLPLPAFYFDEQKTESDMIGAERWNVIDGLQRCSVFDRFIVKKNMPLVNLEFLKQFDGFTYNHLPPALQRRIMQTPLTIYVVESGTPEDVKLNIFKRINTGGLVLTPQEIRHAMNQGIPAAFVEELAGVETFKQATCYKIKSERMEDCDFVTRYVSFYLLPYTSYTPDMDSFMHKGMKAIGKTSEEERMKILEDFKKAMTTAIKIFGQDAFRKRANLEDRRRPINKPLFEVISVLFSKLTDEERNLLVERKDSFKERFMKLNRERSFLYAISSGTSQRDSVKRRFESMKGIINEAIYTDRND